MKIIKKTKMENNMFFEMRKELKTNVSLFNSPPFAPHWSSHKYN